MRRMSENSRARPLSSGQARLRRRNRMEKTHFNVGGPRGWTTACGIESRSFVDKPTEWNEVDCCRCLERRRALQAEVMFSRLGKTSRYKVFGRTRDPKAGTVDTHV